MDAWFERGYSDAKGAGDALSLAVDRIIYCRQGYAHYIARYRMRKSTTTYREYLRGFNSVLPFKDHAVAVSKGEQS